MLATGARKGRTQPCWMASRGGGVAVFRCGTPTQTPRSCCITFAVGQHLSLIHISEPTRLRRISYAVFCLKKKKKQKKQHHNTYKKITKINIKKNNTNKK